MPLVYPHHISIYYFNTQVIHPLVPSMGSHCNFVHKQHFDKNEIRQSEHDYGKNELFYSMLVYSGRNEIVL